MIEDPIPPPLPSPWIGGRPGPFVADAEVAARPLAPVDGRDMVDRVMSALRCTICCTDCIWLARWAAVTGTNRCPDWRSWSRVVIMAGVLPPAVDRAWSANVRGGTGRVPFARPV